MEGALRKLQAAEGAGSGQGAGDEGERSSPSSRKFSQLKERAVRKMRRDQQKDPGAVSAI